MSDNAGDYEATLALAETYAAAGESEKAESTYLKLISLRPDDVDPYVTVAEYFMGTGETNNAIRYYEKALDQNPSDYRLFAEIAMVYAGENKRLDRALELTDRSLVLKADNAPALKAKGFIYYQMEDIDSAKTFLRAALDKDPGDTEVKALLNELKSVPDEDVNTDTDTDTDMDTDTGTDSDMNAGTE